MMSKPKRKDDDLNKYNKRHMLKYQNYSHFHFRLGSHMAKKNKCTIDKFLKRFIIIIHFCIVYYIEFESYHCIYLL